MSRALHRIERAGLGTGSARGEEPSFETRDRPAEERVAGRRAWAGARSIPKRVPCARRHPAPRRGVGGTSRAVVVAGLAGSTERVVESGACVFWS
jgi:hypothetical protein